MPITVNGIQKDPDVGATLPHTHTTASGEGGNVLGVVGEDITFLSDNVYIGNLALFGNTIQGTGANAALESTTGDAIVTSTVGNVRIEVAVGQQVSVGIDDGGARTLQVYAAQNVGSVGNPKDLTVYGNMVMLTAEKYLQPPKMTNAQQASMIVGWGAGESGRFWYNTDLNQWLGWNGAMVVVLG